MRKKPNEKEIQKLCRTLLLCSEKMSQNDSVVHLTDSSDNDLGDSWFDDWDDTFDDDSGDTSDDDWDFSFHDDLDDTSDDDRLDNDSDNCRDSSRKSSVALPPVSTSVYGIQIDGHDFEEAKNNLKFILDRAKTSPELSQVKTSGGLFNWFSHNVTGKELNELTAQIQEYLISLNGFDGDIITQMGELYQTIDALDKDYIQKIIISLQYAEKASQEAKGAGLDAQKALTETNKAVNELAATQKSLQTAQSTLCDTNKKIDKTVSQLEKTIIVLSKFKSEIDNIQHLKDLDDLWSEHQSSKESICKMNDKLRTLEQMVQTISAYLVETDHHGHPEEVGDTFEKGDETKERNRQRKNSVSVKSNHIDELKDALSEIQYESNHKIPIGKKLTIAYALSGASFCLALIELVLLFLR